MSCNWCGKKSPLKFLKSCKDCLNSAVKICSWCSRPFDDSKYFALHPDHCNSCHKKYQKQKIKRNMDKYDENQQDTDDSSSTAEYKEEKNNNKKRKSPDKPYSNKKNKKSVMTTYMSSDEEMDKPIILQKKKKTPQKPRGRPKGSTSNIKDKKAVKDDMHQIYFTMLRKLMIDQGEDNYKIAFFPFLTSK